MENEKEMLLTIDEHGVAKIYNPEFDVTIHCESKEDQEELMKRLKHLYDNEWILVSERLPEPFEFVNCTCHSLIDDREDWVVETCYIPQPHNSPYSDWGNIPMLNSCECEVIAWIHRDIPKPYKAEIEPQESEEEEE